MLIHRFRPWNNQELIRCRSRQRHRVVSVFMFFFLLLNCKAFLGPTPHPFPFIHFFRNCHWECLPSYFKSLLKKKIFLVSKILQAWSKWHKSTWFLNTFGDFRFRWHMQDLECNLIKIWENFFTWYFHILHNISLNWGLGVLEKQERISGTTSPTSKVHAWRKGKKPEEVLWWNCTC